MFDSYLVFYVTYLLKREIDYGAQNILIVFFCALLCFYVVQSIIKFIIELKKLPPGPYGLPLFGILSKIGDKHKDFSKLAKKYGPLFSCKLGLQLYVVISDYKLIREIMKKESVTDRPKTPIYAVLAGAGIINAERSLWKDQRRFLHEKLRGFGVALSSKSKHLRNILNTEVDSLIRSLRDEKDKNINLDQHFALSTSNVICNLLMSVRFSRDDPKFAKFNFMIEEGMKLFGQLYTVDYIPITQYLPTMRSAKDKIKVNRREMFEFYKEIIDDHRKTFDRDNIRDLLDTYLLEIENAKLNNTEHLLFEGRDPDTQIMQIMGDLFSAGMETIKTTLLWLMVFMVRHPEVKQQVQQEIDTIVGRSRWPSIDDHAQLVYTEATILEVMRISTAVPLSTTHSPIIDESLNGSKIPAGSHIVPLIGYVHMDETLWDKPTEFNPSRFINVEGKIEKPEFFMPFGVGRRMCLGNTLARLELFLFFSTLLHQFDFVLPPGAELPSLKGNPGVTISPDRFSVCLKERPMDGCADDTAPLRAFGAK